MNFFGFSADPIITSFVLNFLVEKSSEGITSDMW